MAMKLIPGLPTRDARKGELIGVDLEMFGQVEHRLHRPHGTFALLSIAMGDNIFQIDNSHDVREALKRIKAGTWAFHNALYDIRQLRPFVSIYERAIWDTMLAEQSMWGGFYKNYALDALSLRYLHRFMEKKYQKEFAARTTASPAMRRYAALDAWTTLRIAEMQKDMEGLESYRRVDLPMIWPVMEMPGIRIDIKKWLELAETFKKKAIAIREELGFNPGSPDQVKEFVWKKAKIHLENAQEETLLVYEGNPVIDAILDYKTYATAASRWGAKWIETFVEEDGLVYPDIHINGTETGRFAYRNPNMQQVPKRKEEMKAYRECIIASPGRVLLMSDANQQEPRIMAYLSGDTELIGIFKRKEDIHLAVTRLIFHAPRMVKSDKRRLIGKTINLGTSYGLSAYGLALRLGIEQDDAQEFLDAYFKRFRGVKTWINLSRAHAWQDGYIKSGLGRKVWINPYSRQWENNANNAPIQSTAAEMTKLAILHIYHQEKQEFYVNLQVHDEIDCDVPKMFVSYYRKIVKDAWMSAARELIPTVPFSVDFTTGARWSEKE